MRMPDLALKEAIQLLHGVGGDHEWWTYGTGPAGQNVGYLRVPVTETEYEQCPREPVIADAGESGPQRPRTHPKGPRRDG